MCLSKQRKLRMKMSDSERILPLESAARAELCDEGSPAQAWWVCIYG